MASIIGILNNLKAYRTFTRLSEFEYPDFYIENAVRQSAVFTSSIAPDTVWVSFDHSLLQYETAETFGTLSVAIHSISHLNFLK